MADSGTLVTVAAIISGFGVAMLFFRIQRELQLAEQLEINWIPWADRLMLAATLISLICVLLPIVCLKPNTFLTVQFPTAACAASIVLICGYIFAILAHYWLIFNPHRGLPRRNPEPAEAVLVYVSSILSLIVFTLVILTHL